MAERSPVCNFGWRAPDFRLPSVDGEVHSLADVRGQRGTLVMFLCNHCPYVKAVIDRIVRDVEELAEYGIGAAAIMANDVSAYPEDGFENMKRFAADHGFPFPYMIDETQETARAYGAICTPDFFGFNADLELQYRGRLDESRPPTGAPCSSRAFQCNGTDRPDRPWAGRTGAGYRLLDQMAPSSLIGGSA